MNRQPCDQWEHLVDGADPERARQHIAECVDCQAMLAAEAEWEDALRGHAESLGDFQWSPDQNEGRSPAPALPVSNPNRFGWVVPVAATLLVAVSAWTWWVRGAPRDENLRAAIRDHAAPAIETTSDPKPKPHTMSEPTFDSVATSSPPEPSSVTVRSVNSSSHVSIKQPSTDDGLTFVMFYPRLATQASPQSADETSEL